MPLEKPKGPNEYFNFFSFGRLISQFNSKSENYYYN